MWKRAEKIAGEKVAGTFGGNFVINPIVSIG